MINNADEARKLSEKNLRGPAIEPYLKIVLSRVENACKKGQNSINHPFRFDYGKDGVSSVYGRELDGLVLELQRRGFRVTHHPDPDPGHPCSSDYWTLEW